MKNGTCTGQFSIKAPANPGTYSVLCWLVDKAGNRSNTVSTNFTVIAPIGGVTIRCASTGFARNTCRVSGSINSAILISQYSYAACIKDETWGYESNTPSYIWVDKGCDALFKFYP